MPQIPVTFAGYPCSSHSGEWPTFTGHLSNSTGTMLSETTGDVYGRISNVDRIWQPSPGCGYYRYDGIVWATTNDTSHLTVDWGALSGDGQGCTFLLNTSDYINSDSQACGYSSKLVVTLSPDGTYHNDTALSGIGDFAFAHSDCITWYGIEPIKTNATTSSTSGKPGANCGDKATDSTGTTQTLVVDGTVPSISFSFPPPAGSPLQIVPSAFAGVTFTATDNLAGFGGSDDWDLQRQKTTWTGSVCNAAGWANDGAVVSGTNQGAIVKSQGLALNTCYRWTLGARDQNGNTASTITSGEIYTDTSAVLGDQPQFRTEGFDLGTGDSLAVSAGSGNLRATHPIVSLPIIGGSLDLSATYNSHDAADIGLGIGWRLNVQRRLTVNGDGSVTFTDADGSRHTFTNPVGSPTVTYTRPATLYATLTRDTAATPDRFTLTYRDQSVDVFDEDIAGTGLIKQVKDRFGNAISVAYTAGTAKISTITDPSSRVISFAWTGSYLTQIVDWANVSSGIVQTSGAGNRTHRFFYSGSNLAGWADPLNTSANCPSGGSHVTCLTYTAGLLTKVEKTHTYATLTAGAIGTGTWKPTTEVVYDLADVASVKVWFDASVSGTTTFTHLVAGGTTVTRPGTPASETTYELSSPTDVYGRIDSVKHKLGAAQIEAETTYNATYPIEPATLKENKGGGALERVTSYTYQASSLGLLSRLDEPLDGTYRRYTDFTYNANNDVTKQLVYSTQNAANDTETRYCYTASGCSTSAADLLLRSTIENYVDGTAGGANGHVEDVTTAYQYDAYGQRTRQTRTNYSGSTLLDQAATGWTYDAYGNLTAEIRNYVSGTVTSPGDDITPNTTTNARTDLTTAFTYDTAGNRVSTADPRRAIEALGTSLAADDYITRTVYDARNQALIAQLPTTPGGGDCTPAGPSCRQSPTAYDELGLVRETTDYGGLVTATQYDRAGRAVETYEDTDGAGGTAAAITSKSGYDAQGRVLWTEDRIQANDAAGGTDPGRTERTYDELGRLTKTTEAAGSISPDVHSDTTYAYDSLDRRTSETVGGVQTTSSTYDIGGRVTELNDEFTCTTTAYDYRDLATQVVEGKAAASPCTGAGTRTINNTYDGLGRLLTAKVAVTNDLLTNDGFDAAGRKTYSSQDIAGVEWTTFFTWNPLDQQLVAYHYKWVNPVVSEQTWLQSNYDAAGNQTDRCTWLASPTVACLPADQAMSPQPTRRTTTGYDARNNRIRLLDPAVGETTYDPAANYQVKGVFTPTAAGRELQAIHAWDARNRLDTITHYLCATAQRPVCAGGNILSTTIVDDYAYDDNGNRTTVAENNGGTSATNYYCYDALNRLTGTYAATNCGSPVETYTYDAAGNRTAAGSRGFGYTSAGQLTSCSNPTCSSVQHDADGRLTQINDGTPWTYQYDPQGRLTAACKALACTGAIDRLDFAWGDVGQRVQIKETTAAGAVTTTDLRYQAGAVVQEVTSTGITRTFTVDEAGTIVKVVIAGDAAANNGTYVVTWNGHGDALALWKIDLGTGALTLANSYTYASWGSPTTATYNGIGNLGFRYLYVGKLGVAWDGFAGANLVHMGARHYNPWLGRFLQPDPIAAEANFYAYAENGPVSSIDPSGTAKEIAGGGWVSTSTGGGSSGGGAGVGKAMGNGTAKITSIGENKFKIEVTVSGNGLGTGTPTTSAARSWVQSLVPGYDGGHFIARIFGGKGGRLSGNVFPQNPAINRGAFRAWEKTIYDQFVDRGGTLRIQIRVTLRPGSFVPVRIEYGYRLGSGRFMWQDFEN